VELFRESALVPADTVLAALETHLAEAGDGMAIVVNFDPSLTPEDQVTAMLADLERHVDTVVKDPTIPISTL
jgi:hypothetical protein